MASITESLGVIKKQNKHRGIAQMVTELTMTVEQMAKAIGISRPHAFRMVNEGKIPALRLGKRWLISRKALDEFLAKSSENVG
jgi:excisionase family DNA binding protein